MARLAVFTRTLGKLSILCSREFGVFRFREKGDEFGCNVRPSAIYYYAATSTMTTTSLSVVSRLLHLLSTRWFLLIHLAVSIDLIVNFTAMSDLLLSLINNSILKLIFNWLINFFAQRFWKNLDESHWCSCARVLWKSKQKNTNHSC